jgi:hypothetical protein
MRMRHVAASGVAGFLIILMPLCEADAGIWCPTPIPGVLIKYCLCESITGSADVSSPTPLSPRKLFALRRERDSNAGVWAVSKCAGESANFFRPVGRCPVTESGSVRRAGRRWAVLQFTNTLVTPRRDQRHAFRAIAEAWSASTSC